MQKRLFKTNLINKIRSLFLWGKHQDGAIAIEFAITLPLLIAVFGGVFEMCSLLLINSKLARMNAVIGDVISRQEYTKSEIDSILNNAKIFLEPYDFSSAQIVVSHIHNTSQDNNAANMLISWQVAYNGGVSKYGVANSLPINLPAGFNVLNQERYIVTETSYTYKPLIFPFIFANKIMYFTNFLSPRLSDYDVLKN